MPQARMRNLIIPSSRRHVSAVSQAVGPHRAQCTATYSQRKRSRTRNHGRAGGGGIASSATRDWLCAVISASATASSHFLAPPLVHLLHAARLDARRGVHVEPTTLLVGGVQLLVEVLFRGKPRALHHLQLLHLRHLPRIGRAAHPLPLLLRCGDWCRNCFRHRSWWRWDWHGLGLRRRRRRRRRWRHVLDRLGRCHRPRSLLGHAD